MAIFLSLVDSPRVETEMKLFFGAGFLGIVLFKTIFPYIPGILLWIGLVFLALLNGSRL